MIDPVWITYAVLGGLLAVLIYLMRSAARCPRCGSIRYTRFRQLPWVRKCQDCAEIYEVRS